LNRGRKKKYIEMFGSFTEPFNLFSAFHAWMLLVSWVKGRASGV